MPLYHSPLCQLCSPRLLPKETRAYVNFQIRSCCFALTRKKDTKRWRWTSGECPLLLIHTHNILRYLFVSAVHVERRLDYLSSPSLSFILFLPLPLSASTHSQAEDDTTYNQVNKAKRKATDIPLSSAVIWCLTWVTWCGGSGDFLHSCLCYCKGLLHEWAVERWKNKNHLRCCDLRGSEETGYFVPISACGGDLLWRESVSVCVNEGEGGCM